MFEDHVKREFVADTPDKLWVTDITQHRTSEGWIYCAAVKEISDMLGEVRITRRGWQSGRSVGAQPHAADIAILTPAEVRQIPERHALVVAENGRPIIAHLHRVIDGKSGAALLEAQRRTRSIVEGHRHSQLSASSRATAAVVEAKRQGLTGWTR